MQYLEMTFTLEGRVTLMKTHHLLSQEKVTGILILMVSSCMVPAPVIPNSLPLVTEVEVDHHQGGVEAEAEVGDKVED